MWFVWSCISSSSDRFGFEILEKAHTRLATWLRVLTRHISTDTRPILRFSARFVRYYATSCQITMSCACRCLVKCLNFLTWRSLVIWDQVTESVILQCSYNWIRGFPVAGELRNCIFVGLIVTLLLHSIYQDVDHPLELVRYMYAYLNGIMIVWSHTFLYVCHVMLLNEALRGLKVSSPILRSSMV